MDSKRDDLDALLALSADSSVDEDPALAVRVREMALGVEAEQRKRTELPFWRRRRVILAAAGILALGTTAGTVIPQLNLDGWTSDGVPIEADAVIPINYQTASGVVVSCSYAIAFPPQDNPGDVAELSAFLGEHDWTGIGQEIYEEAVRNPFVSGPNDHGFDNASQGIIDSFSYRNAESRVIYGEIPEELTPAGTSSAGTSDCTGQLR
ncbi:hypothetical protein [Homoserinimonas sp. A520]